MGDVVFAVVVVVGSAATDIPDPRLRLLALGVLAVLVLVPVLVANRPWTPQPWTLRGWTEAVVVFIGLRLIAVLVDPHSHPHVLFGAAVAAWFLAVRFVSRLHAARRSHESR